MSRRRADVFVVADAAAGGLAGLKIALSKALFLGDRDLHMIDVFLVPKRFEYAIGEAKHQQVLDRFLPHVMVDAVRLILCKR